MNPFPEPSAKNPVPSNNHQSFLTLDSHLSVIKLTYLDKDTGFIPKL